jgi:hypothetical protein
VTVGETFPERLSAAADRVEQVDAGAAVLLREAARRVFSLVALTEAYDTRHRETTAAMASLAAERDAAVAHAAAEPAAAAPGARPVGANKARANLSPGARGAPRPVRGGSLPFAHPRSDPPTHPLVGLFCHKTSLNPEMTKYGWHWSFQGQVKSVIDDFAMVQYFDAAMGEPSNISPVPLADLLGGGWVFYPDAASWRSRGQEASERYWNGFRASLSAE